MRILFLDNREIHVGSKRVFISNVYETLKSLNYTVDLNEPIDEKYNCIILGKNMLNDIKNIKNVIKHKCLLGIVNPPNDNRMLEFKNILDFCILGSVEERDSLLKYVNSCIYYPLIEIWFSNIKEHKEKDKLVIGYHGNREHLKSFIPNINWALEKLSETTKIKLKIIAGNHNGSRETWNIGKPKIEIEEVPWESWTIETDLLECDIGLVPNVVNIHESHRKYIIDYLDSHGMQGYKTDYILRFKNKSNIGRSLVFFQLGIPVIADFTPCHFDIKFNETGYLALSKEGWLYALNKLKNVETRKRISKAALDKFKLEYNINIHTTRIYNEIEEIFKNKYL
jgi:hypothetical protein